MPRSGLSKPSSSVGVCSPFIRFPVQRVTISGPAFAILSLVEAFLRAFQHVRYLTFYRVNTDAVEILRVLHGRRNVERDEIKG
ncbi:type II toxin-antitoxin system RelE/ParE family toxin [Mesorhizobium sp. A623]